MQCCPYHTYCRCIALPSSRGPPCAVIGCRFSMLPYMQHGVGSVYSPHNPKLILRDQLLFNLGPPARLATCAERGRGPLRTSHRPPPTPYNRQHPDVKIPVLSPHTLAPQNDRLDEKTQKITFVCSVYARFEELAGF